MSDNVIVDFIPEYDIFGDFGKIRDNDILSRTSALLNILTLIETEPGTIQDIPAVGLSEEILKLFYNENVELQIERIKRIINETTNYYADIKYEWVSNDTINLNIIIEGLPKIELRVMRDSPNGKFKIINYGYLK